MFVGMYVCGYGIWNYLANQGIYVAQQTRYQIVCRSPERALLRHNAIGVRLLTSARLAKMQKYVPLKAKMHVNMGSSLLLDLVQKTDIYAKKIMALPPSASCHACDHDFRRRLSTEGATPESNIQ